MPIIDESINGNHFCYRRNQIQTDLSNGNNLNRVRINIEYAITEIKLAFPAKVGPQKEVLKFNGVQLFFVKATEQEQGLKQKKKNLIYGLGRNSRLHIAGNTTFYLFNHTPKSRETTKRCK